MDQCVTVKNRIFDNQRFLMELAGLDTKQEPDAEDEEDQKLFNEIETVVVKTEIEEEQTFEFNQNIEAEKSGFSDDRFNTPSPTSDLSDLDFETEELVMDESTKKFECKDCGKQLSGKHQLKSHRAIYHPSNKKEMKAFLEKIRRAEDRKQK